MFCNVKRERGTFVCATFFNLQTEQTVLGRIFSTFSFLPSFPLPFITQCSVRSRKRLKTCSIRFPFQFTTLPQFLFRAQNQYNPDADLHKNSGNVRWAAVHLLFTHHSLTIHYEAPLPEYSLGGRPRPVHICKPSHSYLRATATLYNSGHSPLHAIIKCISNRLTSIFR